MSSITDVKGIEVGHAQDLEALTGCTVLLFDEGTTGGAYFPGTASGTRACDLFREKHLNSELHGLLLSGGSNYGLDAAGGVMRFLEEHAIGFHIGNAVVPIVPSAIIYDLGIGRSDVRPDQDMAYAACMNASGNAVEEGSVGAGTGATVGKSFGMTRAMKGGVGSYSIESGYGIIGALAVVNAVGNVVDELSGDTLAGLLDESGSRLASKSDPAVASHQREFRQEPDHTTLAVIGTELSLSRSQLNKLAERADKAFDLAIVPAHHQFDGDVIFAVSTNKIEGEVAINKFGEAASHALAMAMARAVIQAQGLGGVKSYSDLNEI